MVAMLFMRRDEHVLAGGIPHEVLVGARGEGRRGRAAGCVQVGTPTGGI